MREFKYGVGVIATIFLLNLLLVKLSEKSSTKTDFRGKNQKDMSHDGSFSQGQARKYGLNWLITQKMAQYFQEIFLGKKIWDICDHFAVGFIHFY